MKTCFGFSRAWVAAIAVVLASAVGCSRGGGAGAIPGKLRGRIELSPALAGGLKPDDTLYIIVRDGQPGPPVAVKRVLGPRFPLTYTIGAEDAPNPGRLREGTAYVVSARVARSGGTMPKAGDFSGESAKKPARLGDASVDVLLDKQL